MPAAKGQLQKAVKLIVAIATVSGPAVEAIKGLWKQLNESGRLSDGLGKLLSSLKAAATIPDPIQKMRQSLAGIETYLHEQRDMPPARSQELVGRVHACQRRLELAASLDGSARRRVLKGVKKDVADLVKQVLTHGVQTAQKESP